MKSRGSSGGRPGGRLDVERCSGGRWWSPRLGFLSAGTSGGAGVDQDSAGVDQDSAGGSGGAEGSVLGSTGTRPLGSSAVSLISGMVDTARALGRTTLLTYGLSQNQYFI